MFRSITGVVVREGADPILELEYWIGPPTLRKNTGVCADCFCRSYGISEYSRKKFSKEFRDGHVSSESIFNDKTAGFKSLSEVWKAEEVWKTGLTVQQARLMVLPNTTESVSCSAWFESFFYFHGDSDPTSNEIHLEPMNKCDIYEEYTTDMQRNCEFYLSLKQFVALWAHAFPDVKIREYKAVSGKCKTCAALSELRREAKSPQMKVFCLILSKFR